MLDRPPLALANLLWPWQLVFIKPGELGDGGPGPDRAVDLNRVHQRYGMLAAASMSGVCPGRVGKELTDSVGWQLELVALPAGQRAECLLQQPLGRLDHRLPVTDLGAGKPPALRACVGAHEPEAITLVAGALVDQKVHAQGWGLIGNGMGRSAPPAPAHPG